MRRGLILAPTRVLARNRTEKRRGKTLYFRRYPQGKLAGHVVGYSTVSRSRAGLEKSLNGVPHRVPTARSPTSSSSSSTS